MVERRQIDEATKKTVLANQGLVCFIDGHPLASEDEAEFDHIHPHSEGGATNIGNIGVVCRRHNRDKSSMLLAEYRDRFLLHNFFEGVKSRRLDDLLAERLGGGGYGEHIPFELSSDSVVLYFDSGELRIPTSECPATGETYFYASIPVEFIKNDVELQPRSLEPNRLWELYRHLLTHTQLAPAVCRLAQGELLLFDGQHKAAAQVWSGRRRIDCKVYVEPDVRRLKETNLSAHDKLRQMPFYTSTLLQKYAAMATEDWQAFLETTTSKTEENFVDFLRVRGGLSRADARKRLRSLIYRDILDADDNRIRDFITEENRGRQNPITISRMERTFFAEFVATPPLSDEFETEDYHRDDEKENVVTLFNLIVDRALDAAWAPERNDDLHKKAARLFSAGALRAWVPMLKQATAATLALFTPQEQGRLFYRELGPEQWETISSLLDRLLSHKVWVDPNPELNDLRYDNAERAWRC